MTSLQTNRLTIEQEAFFPNLTRSDYEVTSSPTVLYNCIAYSAGDHARWWWPDECAPHAFWPEGLEKVETLAAFVLAFEGQGYVVCGSGNREIEQSYEKVALFTDIDGVPTHAARQLTDGTWTSKLGEAEDIRHRSLEALEGGDGQSIGYGSVTCILIRPVV